jgi:septum formation protein
LHLASSSPRRREILTDLGLAFTHAGVDLDESRRDGESVEQMAVRLAREKAAAALPSVPDLPVLAADTIVVLGNEVYGKPKSKDDALAMLEALSGKTHRVVTGVAVRLHERIRTTMSDTEVEFREIRPDEALRYWQSGEPEGKAGAYAIQGAGGIFVAAVRGSYSGVVGLPVFETATLLGQFGIEILPAVDNQ